MQLRIMKKIIILLMFAGGAFYASAQQIALNSQYVYNEMVVNPAAVGLKDYTPVGFQFRRQWMGIDAAPVTQTVFANGYMGAGMGIGGTIFNDVTGPTRRTGLNVALAYHLKLGSNYNLSFGLGSSLTQFYLNRDKLVTEIQGDQAILNNTNNQLVPDANAGLWLSSERLFVGVSAFNLVQSKVDLFSIQNNITNTLNRTMYFMGGYAIKASDKLDITPSVLFRFMMDAPFALDVNLIATYDKKFWFGGSYRLNDAAVIMAGVNVGQLMFGYSYDLSLSELRTYNSGSHEILIGMRIRGNDKNRAPWKKRNRVYSSFTKSHSFD